MTVNSFEQSQTYREAGRCSGGLLHCAAAACGLRTELQQLGDKKPIAEKLIAITKKLIAAKS